MWNGNVTNLWPSETLIYLIQITKSNLNIKSCDITLTLN